jgi:hypothetical protein
MEILLIEVARAGQPIRSLAHNPTAERLAINALAPVLSMFGRQVGLGEHPDSLSIQDGREGRALSVLPPANRT